MFNKYYINLNRSVDRKQKMEQMYDDITRVEAYDGLNLHEYNDIILPLNCQQNNYELACSFSHIKAIIHSYINGDEAALIFEDDMNNKYTSKWNKCIEEIILNAPENCECISFFCNNIESIKYMSTLDNDYCRWGFDKWSTGCYYINKKGMKKIYDIFYKNGKIDLSIKLCNYVADGGVIYNNLITYNYTKPLFINNLFISTINNKPGVEIPVHNYIKTFFEKLNTCSSK